MMKRDLKLNQRLRRMSQKWNTTSILIQTLRRLASQQIERKRHLKNRRLRRHSSPRVETCFGLHPLGQKRPLALAGGSVGMELDYPYVQFQMANALLHLESLGMIHCDVKPENIMVVDPQPWPLKVKLIDFGLTHHISEPPTFHGTLWYKAPEVLLGLAYTEAIDMWSLGVTMAQLAVGEPLYPGDHPYDVMKFIVETQGPPPDCLLRVGPNTNRYFNGRRIDGQDTWTLKTPELIKSQYGHEFQKSREVILKSLDDIMEKMDISKSRKEGSDFVDLVKRMMCLHMDERIRPADVLNHPFLVEYKPPDVADDLPVLAEENSDMAEDDIATSQEDAETAAILSEVPPGENLEE
ncbi:homeodomain-interacting protein kinase 2-like [Thalassophryne amazonica]|uniref:homeodomain-interacting protein kinase 2-like n=1 Tax=Thalassophryne amazonica TaxID=390379 RepID=UPI001470FFA1|nr:homeodomain-interacting protein kinase 2-like [Thalassophryne amazonica]